MKIKEKINIFLIITTNLIPLLGVFFLQWNLPIIIFLYWVETIFIGFIDFFKINKAEGSVIPDDFKNIKINDLNISIISKKGLARFLIYGLLIMSLACGILLFLMVGSLYILFSKYVIINILLILISHIILYKTSFIDKGEYLNIHPIVFFTETFDKITIMIITIFIGGFFVWIFNEPIFGLSVMIIFKTLNNIFLYKNKKFIKAVSFSGPKFGNYFK